MPGLLHLLPGQPASRPPQTELSRRPGDEDPPVFTHFLRRNECLRVQIAREITLNILN
jgi:hypothetical protein